MIHSTHVIQEEVITFDKSKMHNLITDERKIIEYKTMALPSPDGFTLRLYENGYVQIEGHGVELPNGKDINKEFKIESHIPPEQVKQYANKLVKLGFFNFEDYYSRNVFDGWEYTILLNYQGISKEIDCHGDEPESSEFKEVIKKLDKLVEIELNRLRVDGGKNGNT